MAQADKTAQHDTQPPNGAARSTGTATATGAAAATGTDTRGAGLVIGILVVAAMVMILNETVLSVALPSIMADFEISATVAQWLTTGFMLTMAVVIPITGYLLQRFTTKVMFIAAISLFSAGTLVAAIAPVFAVLLTGRILQASGTALILPLLMTLTLTLIPADRRGSVMGLISVVIAVAPAVGPTVSGVILNSLTWHWLFWLMLPIALLALVVGGLLIRNVTETRAIPLDVPSVVLSALGFSALVYGLSTMGTIFQGNGRDSIIALVIGVTVVTVFILRQLKLGREDRALLNLRPLAVRNYTLPLVILALSMGTMIGVVVVLPLFLQGAMGLSTLTTGLLMLPGGLVMGAASPIIGRLYDALGPKPLAVPGSLLLAAALWSMTTLHAGSPIGLIIAIHVTFSLGMALMMTPLMTVALASLPQSLYSHGSAILNTLQQLAGAAGTAILIATMSIGMAHAIEAGAAAEVAQTTGAHRAFVAAGILALISVVIAPFVQRAEREPVELG